MRVEATTALRVRLQRRWRRLRGASSSNVRFAGRAFEQFIREEASCSALIEIATSRYPDASQKLAQAVDNRGSIIGNDEIEAAALGWAALLLTNQEKGPAWHMLGSGGIGRDGAIEHYIEPLFDYLDEGLDDQAQVLGALLRFRQWCEWFGYREAERRLQIEEDAAIAACRNRQPEDVLQTLMFEHLFLMGLSLSKDVSREPDTGVGRPDFMFLLHGQPIATEVKLFPDSGGKPGLSKGLNQLLTYMDRHQCTTGYLVVFNKDPRGLRCAWADHHGGVPRLTVGVKTVFVLVVASVGDDRSASKRGKPDPVWLEEEDLLPVKTEAPTDPEDGQQNASP